jgi:hypothetical protein
MPDKRTHRGPHPEDRLDFDSGILPSLRVAVADYSLLLTKDYAPAGSLKLVGDHFNLTARQRMAVMRSACSDQQRTHRRQSAVSFYDLPGTAIALDGYNQLITLEAALAGGVIFRGRDGCLRDLAGLHGTYRRVSETIPAIERIGELFAGIGIRDVLWLLDRPVSNSGRLKTLIEQTAREKGWTWQVQLAQSPDKQLADADRIVLTSDSDILDKCRRWSNAMPFLLQSVSPLWLMDLMDVSTAGQTV